MNNAQLIASALRDRGVQWVFGVPSGPVLPLIDALRSCGVAYVLTASETSAGFMATVVGTLTGTPGVAVATLGPGATNLATGLGAAWLDRAPVVGITCNVPTAWLERRVQMRIDHHALMAPLTKASLALRSDNVGDSLEYAFDLAAAEPPGPVHLDLPEDVALGVASPTRGRCAPLDPPLKAPHANNAGNTGAAGTAGYAQSPGNAGPRGAGGGAPAGGRVGHKAPQAS